MSRYGIEERRSHGGEEGGDGRGSHGGRRDDSYEGGRKTSRRDSYSEDRRDNQEGKLDRRRDESYGCGKENSRTESPSDDGRYDQGGRPACRRDDSRGRSSSTSGRRIERRSRSYSRDSDDKKPCQEVQEAPMPGVWQVVEEFKTPSWDPESLLQEPRPEGWIAPTPTPVPLALKPFADYFEMEIKEPSRFDKEGRLDDKDTILRENRDIEEREPLVVLNNLCVVRTDLRGIKESKRRRDEEDQEEEMEFRNLGFRGRGGGRGGRGRGGGRGGSFRGPAEGGDPNKMPVGERRRFGDGGDRNLLERPSDRIESAPTRDSRSDRKPPSSPIDRRPPSPKEGRRTPLPKKEDSRCGENRHASKGARLQQSPRDRVPKSQVEDKVRQRSPLRGREDTTTRRSSYGDIVEKSNTPARGSAGGTPGRSQVQPSPVQGRTSSAAGTSLSSSSGPGMTYKEWKERKARAKAAGQ